MRSDYEDPHRQIIYRLSIHRWWGTGMVICLERCADLHIAQLMPLPLTVSCSSKIQIGFTFLIPAYLGSPGKMAVKRVCVCVLFCQKLITSLVFLVSCSVSAIVLCCWLYFEIFTCAPICENNIIQCLNALGLLSPAHCLWTNSRNTAKSCRE